jgi:hypothetical protein
MAHDQPVKNEASRSDHKTESLTGQKEGGTDMPADREGEDEGSAPVEGQDDHLKDDQKPISK